MSLRTGLFNGLTRETEPLRKIDLKKRKKKKKGERDGTAGLPNKKYAMIKKICKIHYTLTKLL